MDAKPVVEKTAPPVRIRPAEVTADGVVKPILRPEAVPQPAKAAPKIKAERPDPIAVAAPRLARPPRPVTMKPRHTMVASSFVAVVIAPVLLAAAYLFFVAADQYHSKSAFSIRSEEANAAVSGLLGALTQVSSGSASDPDILFEYIRSQKIVEEIDAELNLKEMYQRAEGDWVFALGKEPTVEDLVWQWNRMVHVTHEANNGILQVQTEAFTPEDAQRIAQAILEKSSALVNKLSEDARTDAIRFANDALKEAEANLFDIRQRLTDFRRTNKIVDPRADAEGQLGIVNALQTELARALIERDSLLSFAQPDDPRVTSLDTRIQSISSRIDAERRDLSGTAATESVDIFGAYEDLLVQSEFANVAYTQALAGLATARADARRQARYIAIHVQPTLAETSLYPRRFMLTGLTFLFCLLGWAVVMLIYYNVRDNR